MTTLIHKQNSTKHRTQSMFEQPSSPLVNEHNLNFYAQHNRKKQQVRSATVDLTSKDKNPDFDSLIKQQQKAMTYFNKKHSRANSLRHSVGHSAGIHKMTDTETMYVWQFKADNGKWSDYSHSICVTIENALRNGLDSIEITKESMVYEIRLEHNLECNFATNKMRPIRRVRAKTDEHNAIPKYEDDFDGEFDALSNNLDALAASQNPSHLMEEYEEEEIAESDENSYENEESYDEENDDDEKAETPVESELVANSYGNQYNDYMRKYNQVSKGYAE